MNTTTEQQNITLYYREGSSDKVYQLSLEPAGEGYVVNYAFGKRGTTLTTGTKTSSPVNRDAARAIYEKLVREKKAKGYTEGEAGIPYQHSEKENQVSGTHCQLLNPIQESDLEMLINNPDYWAQEKYDGRRVLIQKTGSVVSGINRKGLVIGLPSTLVQSAQLFPGDFIMDGECVGDILYAFDLLQVKGQDCRSEPYNKRLVHLLNLLASVQQRAILPAITAFNPAEKRDMLEDLLKANKEGIVFKRFDAPYTAGRPNSGGPELKYKFYATVSAVVAKVNAQRSVELSLKAGKQWQTAGNVTIPPNKQIPAQGAVVEIRYLYAFKESGCLYQPTYIGERTDVDPKDCTTKQLKFKAATEEEA